MQILEQKEHPISLERLWEAGLPMPLVLESLCAGFPSPADDYLDDNIDLTRVTALHWAAHLRNYEAVMAILGTSKADFLIRDHNNKSVMDHALAGNHAQIINLILQYQEFKNSDTPQ